MRWKLIALSAPLLGLVIAGPVMAEGTGVRSPRPSVQQTDSPKATNERCDHTENLAFITRPGTQEPAKEDPGAKDLQARWIVP